PSADAREYATVPHRKPGTPRSPDAAQSAPRTPGRCPPPTHAGRPRPVSRSARRQPSRARQGCTGLTSLPPPTTAPTNPARTGQPCGPPPTDRPLQSQRVEGCAFSTATAAPPPAHPTTVEPAGGRAQPHAPPRPASTS